MHCIILLKVKDSWDVDSEDENEDKKDGQGMSAPVPGTRGHSCILW